MIDDLTTLDSVRIVTSQIIVPLGCGCSCNCWCLCSGGRDMYHWSYDVYDLRYNLVFEMAYDAIH